MNTEKLQKIIGLLRKLDSYANIPTEDIKIEGVKFTVTQLHKAPVSCLLEYKGFSYTTIEDKTFCQFSVDFENIKEPKKKKSFDEMMEEIERYLPKQYKKKVSSWKNGYHCD